MEACLRRLQLSSPMDDINDIKSYKDKRLPKECRNKETYAIILEASDKKRIELVDKTVNHFNLIKEHLIACIGTNGIAGTETEEKILKYLRKKKGNIIKLPGAFVINNLADPLEFLERGFTYIVLK